MAHQQLGALALPTNPTNGQTLTLTVNGTAIVITYVSSIGSTPNNVLIQGSAALTAAATVNFLRRPDLTNANQIVAIVANQALLQYLGWSLPSGGTTITPFSLNKNVNGATANLTSFTASTTVTGASWTAQTMQLYVEDGTYYINGTRYLFAGGSTPTVTGPVTHPRIDVLSINSSGTLAWTTGTENVSPVAPAYPANQVPICELYNIVTETALYDNENQQSGQGYIYNDVRPTVNYGIPFSAVPDDILPDATNTRSLGSSGDQWLNIYGENIYNNGALVASSKFGGTGADGALSISSGTTTINCSNAAVVVKNYTSITIIGTANLAFSNPHANGTIVILKSQGNVVITTSATRAIDLRLIGAAAGNNGQGLINGPKNGYWVGVPITGGSNSIGATIIGHGVYNVSAVNGKGINVYTGGGGTNASGGGTPGTQGVGGIGGGGLYIECGGALNFTGTIDVSGQNGTAPSGFSAPATEGYGGFGGASQLDGGTPSAGNSTLGACGGGAGGGSCCILYNSLIANTGTITITGGTAPTTPGPSGGNGSAGWSLVAQNTEFS